MHFDFRVIPGGFDTEDYPDQQRCKDAVCPREAALRGITAKKRDGDWERELHTAWGPL